MNKRILKIFTLLTIFLFSHQTFAAEFLVRDATVTINSDVDPWEMASKWEFDGVGPADWTSPDDYYNGTFYFRFEIISQPTTRACGAQFVIWQDWNFPTSWLEQASGHTMLYGTGSVGYGSGSPAGWWQYEDNPLDFSRPHDFWKLGVMIWCMDPFGQIAYYRVDDGEWNIYDEIWEDRHDWSPLTIRYTIVAVSAGSTFSGDWASYMGGGSPGIQPAYTINYAAEQTQQAILTQHEYSYDYSTWYDGTGTALSLSPSSTVYFRDKNDNGLTQTLVVPARPATPTFSIDYVNERTGTVVSSEYEYSAASNMSGATVGTGTYAAFTPGQNMYFRKLATGSAFRSAIQELVVPARPATPSFTIEYEHERTMEIVTSDYEYSTASDMSGAMLGTGINVNLTPGQNMYFRKRPTGITFRSAIQELIVPDRPAPPVFSIHFPGERTNELVVYGVEYAYSAIMNPSYMGYDSYLDLTPGVDVYFRSHDTGTSFVSEVFHLEVPDRPEHPEYSIDFENEATAEAVPATVIYADNPAFSGSQAGTGSPVDLTPASILYFKVAATSVSFAGDVFIMAPPARPSISSSSSSPTQDSPIVAELSFGYPTSSLNETRLQVVNATLGEITGEYTIPLIPVADGTVGLQVFANAVTEGNFASDAFSIVYDSGNDLEELTRNPVTVFPNPTRGILYISRQSVSQEPERLLLTDNLGRIVRVADWMSGEQALDLSGLQPGSYILRISYRDGQVGSYTICVVE